MPDTSEILDDNIEPIPTDGEYDSTSEFDEGYSQKRITFKSLLAFVFSVLNLERGILFTIKELIVKPKVVIEEYLKHDRKKLINPVRFIVFSTAIATFLMFSFMKMPAIEKQVQQDMEQGYSNGFQDKLVADSIVVNGIVVDSVKYEKELSNYKRGKSKTAEIMGKVFQYNDKLTFVLVFFFALFSLLFFKNMGYNYTEHLVINTYNISMMNVLTIAFFIPTFITQNVIWIMIGSSLSFFYVIYFWMCVYDRKSIAGFFRSLLNYMVSYLVFILITGLLIGIYLLLTI